MGGGTLPDGTNLFTKSTSGAFSYTVVSNAPGFVDIIINGGGGSGGNKSAADGRGAGGGGYSKKHFAVTPGVTVISGSVGGGAAGVTISPGQPGGATTVASPTMTASGGGAGAAGAPGAGGTASGGDVNTTGRAGGLTNVWDGGGSGPSPVDQTTEGQPGNSPGCGGTGQFGGTSGSGADGQVIINARTT